MTLFTRQSFVVTLLKIKAVIIGAIGLKMLFVQSFFFSFLATNVSVAKTAVVKAGLTALFVGSGMDTTAQPVYAALGFPGITSSVTSGTLTATWQAESTDSEYTARFAVYNNENQALVDTFTTPYMNGSIEFSLPAGSYYIQASTMDGQGTSQGGEATINVFIFSYSSQVETIPSATTSHGVDQETLVGFTLIPDTTSTVEHITVQLAGTAEPAPSSFIDLIEKIEVYSIEDGQVVKLGEAASTMIDQSGAVMITIQDTLIAGTERAYAVTVSTSDAQSVEGSITGTVTDFRVTGNQGAYDQTFPVLFDSAKTITVEAEEIITSNDVSYNQIALVNPLRAQIGSTDVHLFSFEIENSSNQIVQLDQVDFSGAGIGDINGNLINTVSEVVLLKETASGYEEIRIVPNSMFSSDTNIIFTDIQESIPEDSTQTFIIAGTVYNDETLFNAQVGTNFSVTGIEISNNQTILIPLSQLQQSTQSEVTYITSGLTFDRIFYNDQSYIENDIIPQQTHVLVSETNITSAGEDVEVSTMEFIMDLQTLYTITDELIDNLISAIDEVVLYDEDRTTILAIEGAPISTPTGAKVTFSFPSNNRLVLDQGDNTLFVGIKFNTIDMQTVQPIHGVWSYLSIDESDTQGIESQSTVSVTNENNEEFFNTLPVGISDVAFVQSYGGYEVPTSVSNNQDDQLLGIIKITADTWETTKNSGSTVSLYLDGLSVLVEEDDALYGGDTLEIRRLDISNSEIWTLEKHTFSVLAGLKTTSIENNELPFMREIESGESAYFGLYGDINTTKSTINISLGELYDVDFSSDIDGLLDNDFDIQDKVVSNPIANTITVLQETASQFSQPLIITVPSSETSCESNLTQCSTIKVFQASFDSENVTFETHKKFAIGTQTAIVPVNGVLEISDIINGNGCLDSITPTNNTVVSYNYKVSGNTDWIPYPNDGQCLSNVTDIQIVLGSSYDGSEIEFTYIVKNSSIPTVNHCSAIRYSADNVATTLISELCTIPKCGNRLVETGEECDSTSASCPSTCRNSVEEEPDFSNNGDRTEKSNELFSAIDTELVTNTSIKNELDRLVTSSIADDVTAVNTIAELFVDDDDFVEFTNKLPSTASTTLLTRDTSQFVKRYRAEQVEEVVKELIATEDDTKAGVEEIITLTDNGATVEKTNYIAFLADKLTLDSTATTELTTAFDTYPEALPLGEAIRSIEMIISEDFDNDGVADFVENTKRNGGDANRDNMPDYQQAGVTTIDSTTDEDELTLDITDSDACSQVLEFTSTSLDSIGRDDGRYEYPYGLNKFTVQCAEVTVKIFYHGITGLQRFDYRKWDGTSYKDMKSIVDYGTENGSEYVIFTIQDGSEWDDDPRVGYIADDNGLAQETTKVGGGQVSSIEVGTHNAGSRFNKAPTDYKALIAHINQLEADAYNNKTKITQDFLRANNIRRGHIARVEPGTKYISPEVRHIDHSPTDYKALIQKLNEMDSDKKSSTVQAIQEMLIENNKKRSTDSRKSNKYAPVGLSTLTNNDSTVMKKSGVMSAAFDRLLSFEFMLKWSHTPVFYGSNINFLAQLQETTNGQSTQEQISTVRTILSSLESYNELTLISMDIDKEALKTVLEYILNTALGTTIPRDMPSANIPDPVVVDEENIQQEGIPVVSLDETPTQEALTNDEVIEQIDQTATEEEFSDIVNSILGFIE